MTDTTAGAAGPETTTSDPLAATGQAADTPGDALADASDRLNEIATEKSLPTDAVEFLRHVLANAFAHSAVLNIIAERQATLSEQLDAAATNVALNACFETLAEFGERLNVLDAVLEGLAENARISSAASVAAPAGVATAPLVAALGRIDEARAAGAIPGVVASILEDLLAALGARPNGPTPPPHDDTAPGGGAPSPEQNPGEPPVAGAPGGN